MTINDILELTKAGFSKDDILTLLKAEQKEPEQKEPEQKEPEQKEPVQEEPEQKEHHGLTREDLREEMQKLALMFSGGTNQHTDTIDEVLAAVINPPKRGEK